MAAGIFLLVALGSNLLQIRYAYFHSPEAGSWGMSVSEEWPDGRVASVEPGSPAAKAGVRQGDRVRADVRFGFRRIPVAGETLRFTRQEPGPATPISYMAARADPPPMVVPNPLDRALDDAVRLLLCLSGLLILLRGSTRSSFILGLALISMSPFPANCVPLGSSAYWAWNFGVNVLLYLLPTLLPLFVITFLREARLPVPRWGKVLFWTFFVATIPTFVLLMMVPPGLVSRGLYAAMNGIGSPLVIADFALTFALFVVGARRAKSETRHRLALLVMALSLIFATYILFMIFKADTPFARRVLTDTSTLCRLLGSLLFAYAILRHRIIDVGFTVNRTLVFGGVSLILLVTFSLAEWAMGQLFAFQGWQGSAVVNAGLAVATVLAFHPVSGFVQHYVSTIFFRPWREKERALRTFVQEASFFTDANRLAARFARALERFSGARCSVYRLDEGGSYVGAFAKVKTVHPDDPIVVALKAQQRVCDFEQLRSAVKGTLAFPMMHGHDLEGFSVLAAKPHGERYRPDEMQLIAWASNQVGQDLYRLSVQRLKAERDEREREIAVLSGRNAELQRALASGTAGPRSSRGRAKPIAAE
jgi:hypothetical protein